MKLRDWFSRHDSAAAFAIAALIAVTFGHMAGTSRWASSEASRLATDTGDWSGFQILVSCLAAAATAWAAVEAGNAARSADSSVKLARENAEKELRAYVNLSSAHLMFGRKIAGGKKGYIDIVFENFGSTPAKNVRLEAFVQVGDELPTQYNQCHGTVGPTGVSNLRSIAIFCPGFATPLKQSCRARCRFGVMWHTK